VPVATFMAEFRRLWGFTTALPTGTVRLHASQ